ncbi:MAG: Zn-dependent exopeptidase M28 [Treponema sp.]|jgi:hypothetical protein|nr:Zn-dependent exopeptidase M28 [Treponema sp.]
MSSVYQYFSEFISLNADRFEVLKKILSDFSVPYNIVSIADSNHVFVTPDISYALKNSGTCILLAHYDRVAGSPGANDNSAAVFQLIEAAIKLHKERERNWLIIFTDKEEILPNGSIRDQGSYGLAKIFYQMGSQNGRFYIFDACGTGDTILLSNTVDFLLKDKDGRGIDKIRTNIQKLRSEAFECARDNSIKKILLVPTPFSDDAGFLSAGIAAQTITVLPSNEAAEVANMLRLKPQLSELLIKKGKRHINELPFIPQTWKRLNGPGDVELFLTPQYYSQIVRFAYALCKG